MSTDRAAVQTYFMSFIWSFMTGCSLTYYIFFILRFIVVILLLNVLSAHEKRWLLKFDSKDCKKFKFTFKIFHFVCAKLSDQLYSACSIFRCNQNSCGIPIKRLAVITWRKIIFNTYQCSPATPATFQILAHSVSLKTRVDGAI